MSTDTSSRGVKKDKHAARKESDAMFQEMDADQSSSASQEEIAKFVASNSQLWSELSRKVMQPPEVVIQVATRVAMELTSGKEGQAALDAELTPEQFHQFRKKYILDSTGSEEFYQRAVLPTMIKTAVGNWMQRNWTSFLIPSMSQEVL
ncbi:expressed unknown protein [Seminavis robusta]|uniref:Uncharacterized protein n=1 Tax=Seminavis robusta TaxID=568900 RepID=A0A9N8DK22_9STRA|nr:expressed unknown protein [Seminavis robusta]|eukprot:Sro171_g075590.1 n/a (149) ;mRNA; f:1698-2144